MIWKPLTVPEDVHAALFAYAYRLEMQTRSRPLAFPEWMRGKRLSAGDVIRYLIERRRLDRKKRCGRRRNRAIEPSACPVQCPDDNTLDG